MANAVHLHKIKKTTEDTGENQGGPYVPLDNYNKNLFSDEDFEHEISYLVELEKVINALPISLPLKQFYVSSPFGVRTDPIRSTQAMHTGIDLAGEFKSKVYSSAPGVVVYANDGGAYGQLIEIDHGSGISSWYGHLERILVTEGETVKRGQLIGLQGNSGRSTGTHLHYEVRINNQPINPANFLEAGKYVF